jgi:hypothetical protein
MTFVTTFATVPILRALGLRPLSKDLRDLRVSA